MKGRVDVWAVVDIDDVITHGPGDKKTIRALARKYPEEGQRVVRLIEHNPAAPRQLRELLKSVDAHICRAARLFNADNEFDTAHDALRDARRAVENFRKRQG